MELIVFLLIFGLVLFGYNRLMGYRRGRLFWTWRSGIPTSRSMWKR